MNYNPFVRGITSMVENASYDEVSHTASPGGSAHDPCQSHRLCNMHAIYHRAHGRVFLERARFVAASGMCRTCSRVSSGNIGLLRFCIRYNSTQFTVRNFFGITRTYTCAEVTEIHTAIFSVCIHVGKKVVRIPRDAAGLSRFCARLRRQYQRTHKTRLPCKETLFR